MTIYRTEQTALLTPIEEATGLRLPLIKGVEEEVYAGTSDGRIFPLSTEVANRDPVYRSEPDGRNIEFSCGPTRCLERLPYEMYARRRQLRTELAAIGPYTLIPGASLSLGDTSQFFPSNPGKPYYDFIENKWHTTVVTAGLHLNVGLDDPQLIIRASRVLRAEASIFLALSAASPFIDGQPTGQHSTRWMGFPRSPLHVPLFRSTDDYAAWMKVQIDEGSIWNNRNLWHSVRPNGPCTPHDLDRLELRICDRVDDPWLMAALIALMEWRIREVAADPSLDPLFGAQDDPEIADRLAIRFDENEDLTAQDSFGSLVWDWRTGSEVLMSEWIESYLTEASDSPLAADLRHAFSPLYAVLEEGNEAMRWLDRYEQGMDVAQVVALAVEESEANDRAVRCNGPQFVRPAECNPTGT